MGSTRHWTSSPKIKNTQDRGWVPSHQRSRSIQGTPGGLTCKTAPPRPLSPVPLRRGCAAAPTGVHLRSPCAPAVSGGGGGGWQKNRLQSCALPTELRDGLREARRSAKGLSPPGIEPGTSRCHASTINAYSRHTTGTVIAIMSGTRRQGRWNSGGDHKGLVPAEATDSILSVARCPPRRCRRASSARASFFPTPRAAT